MYVKKKNRESLTPGIIIINIIINNRRRRRGVIKVHFIMKK